MARADDQSAHAASTRVDLWLTFGRTSLLIASIVIVSALGTFAAVRAWFVPVRGTALVPATLSVDTQPAGAELLIDNQLRGRTPLTLSADPGEHTLTIRAGGTERTVQLTLAAGAQVAQYLDLTSNVPAVAPGRLSIVTDPPGARVVVDGRPRGVSPLVIEDLAAAEHTVTVTSDTGSAQRTVTVTNGIAQEVVFSLPRSTAPVAGWVVVSSPFPVDVIEHDEVVGTSGTAKIMLAAGRHDVVLRNDSVGYEVPRRIEVVPGRVVSVEVIPPKALLNVNARPWADVLIDGRAAGQTPLANIEVAAGPHQITFRHPQLGERTERIVVTANGVNRVAVDLSK
jgi:hypothetical protein